MQREDFVKKTRLYNKNNPYFQWTTCYF